MKSVLFAIAGLLLLLTTQVSATEKLSIYTVNYPLAYFAERIGGEYVAVTFPVPEDVDPAYWMPDSQTIAAYQQADLILLNGANYAKWVDKVSMPRSNIVDTSRKFKDRYIQTEAVTTHSHGAAGAHAHESLAFTTWLNLNLAKMQAQEIYKALARKRPMGEMKFKENYKALAGDLERLGTQIREIVAKDPGRALLGSHPVYDYLSKGYGINLRSVHWEPDQTPSLAQWNKLNKLLKSHPSRFMLWEGTPVEESVQALQAKGIESVVFNPLANKPDNGDFLTVMQTNIDGLSLAYR